MTIIKAKCILASEFSGKRVATLELCYPRFIHSEVMTHRAFSRNASSSRAIPLAKSMEDVSSSPAFPLHVGQNIAGMQALDEVDNETKVLFYGALTSHMKHALQFVKYCESLGIHKQVANRYLEPFSHIRVLVTATEWDNFLEQRTHETAEPHMQILAVAIERELRNATYIEREWHLPYTHGVDLPLSDKIKASVARCARVSYKTHDNKIPTIEQDIELYNRLINAKPRHCSPAEHVLQASEHPNNWHYNMQGWKSHRWQFENEE